MERTQYVIEFCEETTGYYVSTYVHWGTSPVFFIPKCGVEDVKDEYHYGTNPG